MLGRSLLERLDVPVTDTPSGLSTMVLPAGGFGLLVLGIPVPVFSYMGDDNQTLQNRIVEFLKTTAGTTLNNGRQVELHSFSRCFGAAPEEEVLELLPTFGSLNGGRRARYLGVQLVTVLPLSEGEIPIWPQGPSEVRACADRVLQALPLMYWKLDQDLTHVHQSKTPDDEDKAVWADESPA